MEKTIAISVLKKIIESAKGLNSDKRKKAKFHIWQKDVIRKLEKIFGDNSREVRNFRELHFYKLLRRSRDPYVVAIEDMKIFNKDMEIALSQINTYIDEIETGFHVMGKEKSLASSNVQSPAHENISSDNVFIVHGHDEEMKQSVARAVEKLELNPIILHEQPNEGRTVIQKFTDHSNVSFAIVLLSPDDMAYSKKDGPDKIKARARQNVILEMGYFLGKLGPKNVVAIHKPGKDFELPSDYEGVIYIPYDKAGAWKALLVREMKVCGYNVDANKVI